MSKKKQPAASCVHNGLAMTREEVVERHIGDLVEGTIDFIQFHFRFQGVAYSTHKLERPWQLFWMLRGENFRVDEYMLLVGRRVMHLEVEGKGREALALIDGHIATIDCGHVSDEQFLRQQAIYHLLRNRLSHRRRHLLMEGIKAMREQNKKEEIGGKKETPEEYDPGSRPFLEVFENGQMQLDFDSRCLGELDLGEEMGEVEELVI